MIYNRKYKNTQGGQILVFTSLFFTVVILFLISGATRAIVEDILNGRNVLYSKKSFYLSESGTEDAIYRLKNSFNMPSTVVVSLDGYNATTTVANVSTGKDIISTGKKGDFIRKSKVSLFFGEGVAFNYGVQSGEGGFSLANSSFVSGNVYSNGPITGSGNLIKGDVISAGPTGLVTGVHATGSVYSHTINNSTIDKDAYYMSISGTSVGGTSFADSVDQATSSLPIPESTIDGWEGAAETGGVISCTGTYNITGATTLGPVKIGCNLALNSSDDLTLAGPVWVVGNITMGNQSKVRIDPVLGDTSVALIADNPSNRLTSSKINLSQSITSSGVGNGPHSYVLLLSRNNSAKNGGSEVAIDLGNSASGKIMVYAGEGLISLAQSISIKEVTAYKIAAANSAEVIYDTGLANALFSAGPGGGYEITAWKETE